MKIGIDASRYGHKEATGVEWYSFYIINALLKLILSSTKDEIILYCRNQPEFPSEIKNLIKQNSNRISIKVLKAKRFWTLWALSKEIKNNPPDTLFIPSHTLPRSLSKRNVIMIHDVAFRRFPKSYSFRQYLYLNFSTKAAVKKASKILVPSKATADDIKKFFNCDPDKLEVIPHGYKAKSFSDKEIDDAMIHSEVFQHFGIHKNSKFFFYIGRIESKKNILRLLKAFKLFSVAHPKYRLILAGKRGHGFKQIFIKAAELELMDKVLMPGYITEIEKVALYKYCQAFVFPSLYEGFGLPILSGFYYGKPVLCSNTSSIPEVAGDAAHYVDPLDENSIRDGLEKIVMDKEYVDRLVSKGKKRLEHFSWEKSSKKTLTAIYG
ncbi:glycosyltransferase family 4 protein [Patescibacteria group bacterium]